MNFDDGNDPANDLYFSEVSKASVTQNIIPIDVECSLSDCVQDNVYVNEVTSTMCLQNNEQNIMDQNTMEILNDRDTIVINKAFTTVSQSSATTAQFNRTDTNAKSVDTLHPQPKQCHSDKVMDEFHCTTENIDVISVSTREFRFYPINSSQLVLQKDQDVYPSLSYNKESTNAKMLA